MPEQDMSDAPSNSSTTVRRAKPYRCDWRFGIVNQLGDVWTPETFDTRVGAAEYIASAKRLNPRWKLGRHRIVPVKVTVSVSSRKDGASPHQDPGA